MGNALRVEVFGMWAQIVFCRPTGLNILTVDLLEELGEAWDRLERSTVRVCIFRGDGKAFLAGADIKTMTNFTAEQARAFAALGQGVCRAIEQSRIVSIAAIHGACLGGGCELALACDIRLGAEGLSIGQPEVNIGLVPGFGGSQRLPRVVGEGWALRMILSGEPLKDAQALQCGLVTEVLPPLQLQPYAETLAQTLLTRGPGALSAAKSLVRSALHTPLDAGLAAEAKAFGNTFETREAREGTQAFIEKRMPRF
jgi:enoyl-CoA hydratase/carnithine racemase